MTQQSDQNTKLFRIGKYTGTSLRKIILGMAGGGDSTKFLAGDCTLRTPAGGGESSLTLLPGFPASITDQTHYDVTLLDGYSSFLMRYEDLDMSADSEWLAVRLSFDGGETFLGASDSYNVALGLNTGTNLNAALASSIIVSVDSTFVSSPPNIRPRGTIDLYPGSATSLAYMSVHMRGQNTNSTTQTYFLDGMLYPGAEATPSPERATTVRFISKSLTPTFSCLLWVYGIPDSSA